jgi:pSer/pThr/pTyr-binding forkhead associated (FHA) protein
MPLTLTVLHGHASAPRLTVAPAQGPLTIGRSRTCGLVVDDGYVSDTHAAVYLDGAGARVRDLGSHTGTWLNGQGVAHEAPLQEGDRLQIGQTLFGIELTAEAVNERKDDDDLSALASAMQTSVRDCARFALRAEEGTMYALIDLAADAEALELLNESGEQFCALDEGTEPDAPGETAPCLVALSPGSPLLGELLERAWGNGWCVFFTSDAAFHDVYAHWLQRVEYDDEGNVTSARAWVPEVLGELLAGVDGAEVRALFGPVRRFLVEDEEGTGLVRWVEGDAGVESERVELRLNVPSERASR